MSEESTITTHRFTDESPINGLCDTCGSSVQFHAVHSDFRGVDTFDARYVWVAVNSHAQLVAALETARKMNQYIVGLSDGATVDNARQQARQALIVINEALTHSRQA